MRSMYGPDTLLLASKKPRIRELVARARVMSEHEIQSLPEKPDVIRGLLLIRELGDQTAKATLAEKIASAMQRDHVDQPRGIVLGCNVFKIVSGGEHWIKTGSTLLEIKEGWHWAQMESGAIYLADAPVLLGPDAVDDLMTVSQYIGKHTLEEYKDLERKRRNSLLPTFIFQSI